MKWLNPVWLIENVFTLHGGQKGGGTPKTPDYASLAEQQAQNQLELNRSTTKANRIDQYTPFGSITYTQGGGDPYFDQAAYDAAMAAYNKQVQSSNNSSGGMYLGKGALPSLGGYLLGNQGSSSGGYNTSIAAPNKANFYRTGGDPDKWSSTVTLTPEVQAIVDQKLGAQSQNYDALQSYLKNIQDSSIVPDAVIHPGQTAQDAIMARLNPTYNTREEQLRTQLYNQGVRPGSEAWDNEFRNFNQGLNDAYSQAALYGINLDNQARQNALQEQALPMNAIQAYVNGTQTPYPTFQNYANQANAQSADLTGAAQAAYNGQLNSYNANQAANSNFMSGLFGLGGSIFGGPIGGALGSAIGGLF